MRGGPYDNFETLHFNFDHHDGVIREATMSTANQIYFAIKGGMVGALKGDIHVWVNDTDQDTSLAVWLLLNHERFEGTNSIPHINRLLALTDRLDITGGAFPMNLDDDLLAQHNWIFEPYMDLRTSGELARASGYQLRDNYVAVASRLQDFMMNRGGRVNQSKELGHKILYRDDDFTIYRETWGSPERYQLFSKGMKAFIAIIAERPDGRRVCSIGRYSKWVTHFPLPLIYDDLNAADGLTRQTGWNGSDIVGGSSRSLGTGLTNDQLRDIVTARIKR